VDLVTAPTVIAIDPGGTTGWSRMVVHPEALSNPDVSVLEHIEHHMNGEIRAIPPALAGKVAALNLKREERRCVNALMRDVMYPWFGAAVVIEDFLLRKKSMDRELLSPVRLTAALEYAVEEQEMHMTLHLQQPSEKEAASDDRLKRWKLYVRAGGMQHARDADRHAIIFLKKAKQRGSIRGQAWPHLYTPSGELRPGVLAAA
jgi:hypothetical protein